MRSFVQPSRQSPPPHSDWRASETWSNGIANIEQTLECNMQLRRQRQEPGATIGTAQCFSNGRPDIESIRKSWERLPCMYSLLPQISDYFSDRSLERSLLVKSRPSSGFSYSSNG